MAEKRSWKKIDENTMQEEMMGREFFWETIPLARPTAIPISRVSLGEIDRMIAGGLPKDQIKQALSQLLGQAEKAKTTLVTGKIRKDYEDYLK